MYKQTTRNRPKLVRATLVAAVVIAAVTMGCYSPVDSQKYFAQAGAKDPALELIHRTALYNVFYDHALRRCVLHAAHSWGEQGGGGGGTGIGVYAFRCDPARIKEQVKLLNLQIEDIKDPGETPAWEKTARPGGHDANRPPAKKPPPANPEVPQKEVAPEPYGDGQ